MITAEEKPFDELTRCVEPYDRILLVGCNECVTVCSAGGRKEVAVLASALRMQAMKRGRTLDVREHTLERQCDPEYVEELVPLLDGVQAVMSMACGCGVQELARRYHEIPVFPAVNTRFMGASVEQGVWAERCAGCGDCVLASTGGICPVARCSKRLFNGPCGGSTGGACEISPDVECAWQLIWDRLKALGTTHLYEQITPAKDWRSGRGGGPRIIKKKGLADK